MKLNLHTLVYTRSTTLSLQYPLALMIPKKETPVPFLSPNSFTTNKHIKTLIRNRNKFRLNPIRCFLSTFYMTMIKKPLKYEKETNFFPPFHISSWNLNLISIKIITRSRSREKSSFSTINFAVEFQTGEGGRERGRSEGGGRRPGIILRPVTL